jgi:dinuclear metal center YbgI/SA1388 family protein
MSTVRDIRNWLERFAPPVLAESWDNVGLLVGDPEGVVERLMTCLTVTPETVAEAVRRRADLVVAHHPLPFKPLPRVTTETTPGRLVWQLARAGVSLYSPHTAFDSARDGINQWLAEALGLDDIDTLVPVAGAASASSVAAAVAGAAVADGNVSRRPAGTGRRGVLAEPRTLFGFANLVAERLAPRGLAWLDGVQRIGDPDRMVRQVGIACGSAGSLLPAAKAAGCDVLLTGEATYHTCLEARAIGVGLVLAGHHATERPGVEQLARALAADWPTIEVWAAEDERDPVEWHMRPID